MSKHQDIHILKGNPPIKRYFQGEMMTCVMCGKEQKSHPRIESNWTIIEEDGEPFYVCPDELPLKKNHPSMEDFSVAYQKIFLKIAEIRNGRP